VAFWVTRRICIGLQRRDASMLEHGVETGIIRQLPNGAFVELERPVTEEEAAELISAPPTPLALPRETDDNGLPAPATRRPLGRVQALARDIFAEGISLAPPTGGHGNGHGEDGHNGQGEVEGGDRAAVGAGQNETDRPADEGE
jgi:ubiquinol-cytochrome c reductase cytochrome b subunit